MCMISAMYCICCVRCLMCTVSDVYDICYVLYLLCTVSDVYGIAIDICGVFIFVNVTVPCVCMT